MDVLYRSAHVSYFVPEKATSHRKVESKEVAEQRQEQCEKRPSRIMLNGKILN